MSKIDVMKVEWRSIMSVFWGNVGGWWRVEKSADCGKAFIKWEEEGK